MATVTNSPTFAELPDTAVQIIAAHLTAKQLSAMSQVCRAWRNVGQSQPLWEYSQLPQRFPWVKFITRLEIKQFLNLKMLEWSYPPNENNPGIKRICERLFHAPIESPTKCVVFEIPTNNNGNPLNFPQVHDLTAAVNGLASKPVSCFMRSTRILPKLESTEILPGHYIMSSGLLNGTINQTRRQHEQVTAAYECHLPQIGPLVLGCLLINNVGGLPNRVPSDISNYSRTSGETSNHLGGREDIILGMLDENLLNCGQARGFEKFTGVSICEHIPSNIT